MRRPEGYRAYQRSPDFTEASIPAALRAAHRTKSDVWALIHVLEGWLPYLLIDAETEIILDAGATPRVIEAYVFHAVAPLGPVRFFVDFHRPVRPASG